MIGSSFDHASNLLDILRAQRFAVEPGSRDDVVAKARIRREKHRQRSAVRRAPSAPVAALTTGRNGDSA